MSDRTRKAKKPSVKRDDQQFRDALGRHFRLLSKAAAEYDAGDDDQIVNMAALLRALLKDRLIDRVTPLNQMRFANTSERLPRDAIGGYGYGITRVLMVNLGDESRKEKRTAGRIVAPLGDGYDMARTVLFSHWWSRDKVVYPTNLSFLTREYVIYEMANTDAVHIDAELDAEYDALTRDNHGFTIDGASVTGNLASAAVRQITWETQYTLHRKLPELCSSNFPGTSAASFGGTLVRVAAYADASGGSEFTPDNKVKLDVQGLHEKGCYPSGLTEPLADFENRLPPHP